MNDIMRTAALPVDNTAADAEMRAHLFVSGSDIFALGHYPSNPIYPGVLIAEQFLRLAEAVAGKVFGGPATVAAIKRIQYLDAVVPGDVLELVASVKKRSQDGLEIALQARVGETVKTRATLLCKPGMRHACEMTAPALPAASSERTISHRALSEILPHRYPFLLVDVIEDFQAGDWLRARKVINRASPLFLDGFPSSYPHGLVLESIGQAGIALYFLSREGGQAADIVLGSICDAELISDIPFDAVLTIEARIERQLTNGVVLSGEARIGQQVVSRVGNLIAMIDPR
jgi:3-hydroxymyristoyl/3-hydroxydecanoyl-(acyl carrier protein) dehydratase